MENQTIAIFDQGLPIVEGDFVDLSGQNPVKTREEEQAIIGYKILLDFDQLKNQLQAEEIKVVKLATENNFLQTSVSELKAVIAGIQLDSQRKSEVIEDLKSQVQELNKEFLAKVDELGELLFKFELSEYDRIKAGERVQELQNEIQNNEIMLSNEQTIVGFKLF